MSRPIWIETASFYAQKKAFINCAQMTEIFIVKREDRPGVAVAASRNDRIGAKAIAFFEDAKEAARLLDALMERIEELSDRDATECVIWQEEINGWIAKEKS